MSQQFSDLMQIALANSVIAGNIVMQHFKNQKVRCVDFEGKIEHLKNIDDNHPGVRAYAECFERDGSLLEDIKKDGNAGFFKISIEGYFLFDSYGDERGKYHLPWERSVV